MSAKHVQQINCSLAPAKQNSEQDGIDVIQTEWKHHRLLDSYYTYIIMMDAECIHMYVGLHVSH